MMDLVGLLFIAAVFCFGIIIGDIMATATKANRDDADEKKEKQPKDAGDGVSRTVEHKARFPVDMALRQAGYAIYSRPANGEPVWTKGGVEFREREALMRLPVSPELSGVFVG